MIKKRHGNKFIFLQTKSFLKRQEKGEKEDIQVGRWKLSQIRKMEIYKF